MRYLEEHNEHCKRTAEGLRAYAAGEVYRCPVCGGEVVEDGELNEAPVYRCECGQRFAEDEDGQLREYYPEEEGAEQWGEEVDELEQLGLIDYFNDCLDIEYRVGSDRKYRSCRVLVAWGGPNIYIDSGSGNVELYWWGEGGSWPLDNYTRQQMDELFEELFMC